MVLLKVQAAVKFNYLAFMPFLLDIRNWIRNIEQHASDNVNKVLVGNKADMDESKRVCFTAQHCFSFLRTLVKFS